MQRSLVRNSSMLMSAVVLVAIASVRGASAQETAIAPEALTDEHVNKAIGAMVRGLYQRRDPQTFWEPPAGRGDGSQFQVGGYTALVALAMLYAGESYQQPELREAIRYLETADLHGTYAVAVRASLWAILPPRFRDHLQHDAQWLMDGFSPGVGSWAYYQLPTTTRRDNSLRQFGALGLWEAAKRGVRVPADYWLALERGFLDMQLADGGWNYTGSGPATGSMTAAGLATLLIIQDFLRAEQAIPLDARRRTSPSQDAIDNAMAWMHEHFLPTENPGRDSYFYYYLYGVERVGLAGGYKYLGGRDWYREGAAELIRRLCQWDEQSRTMTLHTQVAGSGGQIRNDDIAFALMFLSRGRMASVINKLQDDTIDWNNRPRDVPNLANWIAGETARHVIWQITDINAPAHEWLDAPMQYFASHREVPWAEDPSDQRMKRLKQYLDMGGLLFAVNEGSGRAFAESIEQAGTTLYPQYQWRTLDADHWAYTIHQPVQGNRPRLRGLSNGVRELIIVVTDSDLSATFQVRNLQQRAHYHTASNVYFYASEMGRPRTRLDAMAQESASGHVEADRSDQPTVTIVLGQHAGNWNAEPHALHAFAQWFSQTHQIELAVQYVPIEQLNTIQPRPALLFVSGVDAVVLTSAQRTALQQYINAGGLVLIETAGGMGDFAQHAEAAIEDMLGQAAQSTLRHEIITGEGVPGGKQLSRLDYRPYTLEVIGSLDTTPRLRGIRVDGHWCALFSRDDLSHALLDQPCWGVNGYSSDSARRLLANIMHYAMTRHQEQSR